MNLGTRLALWAGPTVPVPLAPTLLESLEEARVTTGDRGRSGFQLTFRAGRDSMSLLDYQALLGPQLRPFNRVILVMTFGPLPEVLMDGVITNQQLSPGSEPGTTTITVTGEDLSVLMDLEERSEEHPAQPEPVIALKILARYARYGVLPMVIPPVAMDIPLPIERTPVQQGTDLAYLEQMAERFSHVFYVTPGPAPLTSTAYWGPPVRVGVPQPALSVNLGPSTNVDTIQFQYDGLAPTFVEGEVQDRRLNTKVPVRTGFSTRIPLVPQPAWLTQPHVRVKQQRVSGLDTMQALTRAQADTDSSQDNVVTASGSLDGGRYGRILRPRGLVGLRGAGFTYDGLYYVQQVSHQIRRGSYTQDFTLTREGTGSITPVVIP